MGNKQSGRPGGNPDLGPGPGRKKIPANRKNSIPVYISPDLKGLLDAASGDQDWREWMEKLIWRHCSVSL